MSTLQLSPNLGESPEHIAFRLFELIVSEEGPKQKKGAGGLSAKWMLETYAKCLVTVRKPEAPINWSAIGASARI